MARSAKGGVASSTESLRAWAPTGMTMEGLPLKVTACSEAGLNGGFAGAEGDGGGVDAQRLGAELVGDVDAQGAAGDGGMDDLAEGGVDEGGNLVPGIAAEGRGGPGADPLLMGRRGIGDGLGGNGGGEEEESGEGERCIAESGWREATHCLRFLREEWRCMGTDRFVVRSRFSLPSGGLREVRLRLLKSIGRRLNA
jgi:hypothetical protein